MGYGFWTREGPRWYTLSGNNGREIFLMCPTEKRYWTEDKWQVSTHRTETGREMDPSKLEQLGLAMDSGRKICFAEKPRLGIGHKLKVAGVYAAGVVVLGTIGYFVGDAWSDHQVEKNIAIGLDPGIGLGYFYKGVCAMMGIAFGAIASRAVHEEYLSELSRIGRILIRNSERTL